MLLHGAISLPSWREPGWLGGRLQWITALCMLINRHPFVETFSAPLIVTVHELLADIEGAGQMTGRWALLRLQTSLCHLGILDQPAILDSSREKTVYWPAGRQNDASLDPLWGAWVRAFYDQTPFGHEIYRRQTCHFQRKQQLSSQCCCAAGVVS